MLRAIFELFEQEIHLSQEGEKYYLALDLPHGLDDAQGALEAAQQVLARLNAIAHVHYGNHHPVKIGEISHTDQETGKVTLVLLPGSAQLRFRGGTPSVTMTSPDGTVIESPHTPPYGDLVLAQAEQNDHLERALYLYGSLELNWRGLYMVLEAIQDANGREKGLIAKKWVPRVAIKAFKDTANSFRAIGRDARHGSLTIGSEHPKQTLETARALIRELLAKWIEELRQAPTGPP